MEEIKQETPKFAFTISWSKEGTENFIKEHGIEKFMEFAGERLKEKYILEMLKRFKDAGWEIK